MPQPLRPGLYDRVIDRRLRRLIDALDQGTLADEAELDAADVPDRLSRLFAEAIRAALASLPHGERRTSLLERLRQVLAPTDSHLTPGELELEAERDRPLRLLEVRPRRQGLGETRPTRRPSTPLADSALLMNAPGEPALAQELQAELASADRVDLLIALVKWSGIRLMRDAIEELIARGGRVRVLTTTYTGASDADALLALARSGAEVRISYDNRRTRLHAKAWIFHRDSGATTAYIGSSNLSRWAMLEGLDTSTPTTAALDQPANRADAALLAPPPTTPGSR